MSTPNHVQLVKSVVGDVVRRVVCLSDTHCLHNRLTVPDGDILIHAGDFTSSGATYEIQEFADFLARLPHKHKIVIAGNHDFGFETNREKSQKIIETVPSVIYLQDSGVNIDGINIYGSPWQPRFCDWAFNLDRGPLLKQKWALIPHHTDILVTHGPPMGICDYTAGKEHVGCEELLAAIQKIKPRVHIFGHIHEGYGTHKSEHTLFVNASNCNYNYRPNNPIITFDISPEIPKESYFTSIQNPRSLPSSSHVELVKKAVTEMTDKEDVIRRVVCLSDTHSLHSKLSVPDGDILIHAGDFTRTGTIQEVEQFAEFLALLPHKHKLVIAGNHELSIEQNRKEAQKILENVENVTYLQDSAVTIDGLNIYGSPWQPRKHYWAFNLARGAPLKEKWELIPKNTDILVTHGPPMGILDFTSNDEHAGCEELLVVVQDIKPRVHIFGHIHEGYGTHKSEDTLFINASNCDRNYKPNNPIITFDISPLQHNNILV